MKNLHHPKNKHVHVTTYFWPNITTGREKRIYTSPKPNISQEPHDCGKLYGVQIFLVQVTVEKWPQDQYFSPKVLLYPFLTQYYNRKGKKDMELSYTTHIKRTSQVWKDIWVPDIFNNNKVGKWLQDHYFSPKVLLVGTPSIHISMSSLWTYNNEYYFFMIDIILY